MAKAIDFETTRYLVYKMLAEKHRTYFQLGDAFVENHIIKGRHQWLSSSQIVAKIIADLPRRPDD